MTAWGGKLPGPIAGITALALMIAVSGCNNQNTYRPPPPQQVMVQPPIQRKVTLYTEFTGTTVAVNQVDLVARVQGFLDSIGFNDGDRVTTGQVLFSLEKAPYQASLDIANAGVAEEQALLTQANTDLTRQSTLVTSQAVSQATLDDARAKRDSTQAALMQAQGQVEQAKINLGYTDVKAPFDGVISAHLVDPGALVGAGGATKLATLVQLDPIYVTFNINEQQALQVRRSLTARGLTFQQAPPYQIEVGLQTEQGFPHQGTIDYASPTVDTGTGTVSVRGVLDNKDSLLFPGLFVRVRVPTQQNVDALLVPDAALGTNQQGRYLLVVDDKNIVQQEQVGVGDLVDGGLRVITSGLEPSQRVIVGGLERAIPGNEVAPVVATAAAGPAP